MNIESSSTNQTSEATRPAGRRRTTRSTTSASRTRRPSSHGLTGAVRREVTSFTREAQQCLRRPGRLTCAAAAWTGADELLEGLQGGFATIRHGMENNPAQLSPTGTTVRQPGDPFPMPAGA